MKPLNSVHILHTTDSMLLESGGIARFVTDLLEDGKVSMQVYTAKSHKDDRYDSFITNLSLMRLISLIMASFFKKSGLGVIGKNQNPDLVHQHGLWSLTSFLASRIGKCLKVPVLCSPHGMLEPWALLRSKFKKKAALNIYQAKTLKSVAAFHATSKQEALNIRKNGFLQPIAIIPVGVHLPELSSNAALPDIKKKLGIQKKKILLFLSRIHPKKGIDLLIDVWCEQASVFSEWQLVIAGSGEKRYVDSLKLKTQKLNNVSWVGFLNDADKDPYYRCADLFVLPSYSENYGCVISEAMAYGIPVITTNTTPWSEIQQYDCGWWIDLKDLAGTLRKAAVLTGDELRKKGLRGRDVVQKNFLWSDTAEKMINLYQWIKDPTLTKPDYVMID